MHTTSTLEPSKNYLIVNHPHGVMFFGFFLGFSGFQKFGLKCHLCTLNCNFMTPIAKEYILAAGFVGVSEKSLKYLLAQPEGGNIVCLIPGGASEAALTCPGEYRIVLKNRMGFCRVALETGADIVPSFTFGEVDALDIISPPKDSIMKKIQEFIKKITMTYLVIYKGSLPFSYWLALPKKIPINIVVGKPISIKKNSSPTKEEIKKLHETYITAITRLFDEHKDKYLKDKNYKLIIE